MKQLANKEELLRWRPDKGSFKMTTKITRAVIVLCSWLAIVLIISPQVLPQAVNLQLGQPSAVDIVAPRTIVDRLSTEALQTEAMAAVPTIWEVNTSVKSSSINRLNAFLQTIRTVNGLPLSENQTRLSLLKERLDAAYVQIPEANLLDLLQMNDSELTEKAQVLLNVISEIYDRGVKEADLSEAKKQGRAKLSELLPSAADLPVWQNLLELSLQVNVVPNLEATRAAQQAAKDQVEAIVILKGQSILRKGQLVDEHQWAILSDLGMLDADIDWLLAAGSAGFVLLLSVIYGIALYLNFRAIFDQTRLLSVIALIMVLTLLLGRAVMQILPSVLIPVPAAVLILAVLFDDRLALLSGIFLSILASLMADMDFTVLVTFLLTSWVTVLGSNRIRQRTELIYIGAWVGAAGFLSIGLTRSLLSGVSLEQIVYALWGAAIGVITGILALGLLPFFEMGFRILTPLKLLELANSNHPLLKRLLMEAPGTYQHSMMVANLAEGAAEAIGADALLVRAGAYFHDVGKIRRPMYFVENQTHWDNPHDGLPPQLSAAILVSHVKEGLELGREYKLPVELMEFIATHQGNMTAGHFYNLAKEQAGDALPPKAEDFSYPGPIPVSKEAAILMLADCCEAAVRSIPDATPEKITEMVRKLVKVRISSGQLNDCALSLHEIDQVENVLISRLISIYHKRIQYKTLPEQLEPTEERQASNPKPDNK
ncbi:MAG: HDIG domain-containing protein [Negativicutes bacterium]|nr:HDIG domain-containing protein [Negativicutes bacterium]